MEVPFNSTTALSKFFPDKEKLEEIFTLSGGGRFDSLCSQFLSARFNSRKALITPSCSAAIEMSMLLLNLNVGDEVIMPSYTFSSTANAVALRGATPVFVDVDPNTLNIDPNRIIEAITKKTKCILVVHYGGISCDMDLVLEIARRSKCFVVEDAAQAIGAKYKEKYLGSLGDLGTFSFHETKNIVCGEGGSILFRENQFIRQAEIIREKGTNRREFLRGEIDKYTWQTVGSSYLAGEATCFFLYHQLFEMDKINSWRIKSWKFYFEKTEQLELQGFLKRQSIPEFSELNGHMFFIIIREDINRELLIAQLKEKGVMATSHYIPLHDAPAGRVFGKTIGSMSVTNNLSKRLIRLPLYYGIQEFQQEYVIEVLDQLLKRF